MKWAGRYASCAAWPFGPLHSQVRQAVSYITMGGEDEAQECARRYAAWTNDKGARSRVNVIKLVAAQVLWLCTTKRSGCGGLHFLRAWLVGHVIAVEAWSFASWIQPSRANRLDGTGKDVDQGAQQFQGIGSGQQTDQCSLHRAKGMGEIDLLGMDIAAVLLVHLLLGGVGQHHRQVQREAWKSWRIARDDLPLQFSTATRHLKHL